MGTLKTDSISHTNGSSPVSFPTGISCDGFIMSYEWVDPRAYGAEGSQAAISLAITGLTVPTGIYLSPVNWNITSDLTIPSNAVLKILPGTTITIPNGVTLTINGKFEAGLHNVFILTGTGKVLFNNGACSEVIPEWYGAIGDGVTECYLAIKNAIVSSQGDIPIVFYGENYKCTDSILTATDTTLNRYSFVGKRLEMGCNAAGATPAYTATKITFSPADTTKYLIERYDTAAGYTDVIGPFEHKNLLFNIGNSNGFRFGLKSAGTNQDYIFGVRFHECAIHATIANANSDATGAVTRSGKYMVRLARTFEAKFENVSLFGCDTQIDTYACDFPQFKGIRSQYSHVPFFFEGLTTGYTKGHNIDDLECEGWTFSPIIAKDVELNILKSGFECNIGSITGMGYYTIPGAGGVGNVTTEITENSDTLTFSKSMTNILFPDISVIRVFNGTTTASEYIDLLVKTVSDTIVTVYANNSATIDTYATTIPFTNIAAEVQRIQGGGPLVKPYKPSTITASYFNPWVNSPSVICALSSSTLKVSNCGYLRGSGSSPGSIVLGNRLLATLYLDIGLWFDNCDPIIIGDPGHPFVKIIGQGQSQQANAWTSTCRTIGPSQFEEFGRLSRVWALTPKAGTLSSSNNCHRPVVIRCSGERTTGNLNVNENIWAWKLRGSEFMIFKMEDIPPRMSWYRLLIKCMPVAAAANLRVAAQGYSVTDIITSTTINPGGWRLVEAIFPTPPAWYSNPTTGYDRGIRIYNSSMYIAGAWVEELTGKDVMDLTVGVIASAPTISTHPGASFYRGQRIWVTNPTVGSSPGYMVTSDGSFSSASEGGVSVVGSNIIIDMIDTSDFVVGHFVSDTGGGTRFPDRSRIIQKTATTLTLNNNATLAGAVTVTTPDPVFATMGILT
jgi:hypothetical protein